MLEPTSPAQDVVIQDSNEGSNSSNEVVEDTFDMLDFEQNVVPGFINDNTFQTSEFCRQCHKLFSILFLLPIKIVQMS